MMHEKGIADQYEEVVLNMLEKGDQKSWKHHKMNPQGRHRDWTTVITRMLLQAELWFATHTRRRNTRFEAP